ncbi:Transient receptor putative cation channel sub V member 5 [Cladochytrium tenue]|nr:Transient receptor putative cation channel sub V member 5 [Cladochytrium tenue]
MPPTIAAAAAAAAEPVSADSATPSSSKTSSADHVLVEGFLESHHRRRQADLLHDGELWESVYTGKLEETKLYTTQVKRLDDGLQGPRGLYERGGEGETILHIAVLMNHTAVAKWIIDQFPQLINDIYMKHRYFGETSLHIACVRGNLELVKYLVEHGAVVNGPLVSGTEFLKDEDRGCLYYGQTPLQFAAVNGKLDIVKYLVENCGADMTTVDLYGNNVLHVLAYYGVRNLEMYRYFAGKDPSLAHARNKDNFTPFQVGISRGHANVIETIKETAWEFGSVRQYRVPLADIDPIQPHDPKTLERVSKSALEIACEREDKDVISSPLFDALLKVKWVLYGRRKFIARFFFTTLLICCMTVAIGLQPHREDHNEQMRLTYDSSTPSILRAIFELLTVLGTVIMISFELRDVIVQGLDYFSGYGATENVVQWTFSVLVWLVVIVRFGVGLHVDDDNEYIINTENVLLGFIAIIGWMYILFFAKGFPALGPLTLIFRKILLTDLLEWLALYLIFTMGFASALYLQMGLVPEKTTDESIPVYDWNVLPGSILWTVRFIFAQAVFDDLRKSKLPAFTEFLFVLYGFLTLILLVNVLIAKLTETFKSIALDSRRQWRVQFAYLILELDARLSDRERKLLLQHMGHLDPNAAGSGDAHTRYLLFTERTTERHGKPHTETMKLVVAVKENMDEVEVHVDTDHWDGWMYDLLPRSNPKSLWEGHRAATSGDNLRQRVRGELERSATTKSNL